MFMKYTALAAGLLLTLGTVFASGMVQADTPTCDLQCGTKKACVPTCEAFRATGTHIDSTKKHPSATILDSIPTCGTFCCEISPGSPTSFPLAVSSPGRSEHSDSSISSPVDDYTTHTVSVQEQKLLNLLNQDRENNGLAALSLDPELSRIARIKSADMRDNNYFAHESPIWGDVRAMLRQFSYPFRGASENIAHHANVDKAQAAFMTSPGHRRNILGNWAKVGIGIVYDKNGYIFATQIFAR